MSSEQPQPSQQVSTSYRLVQKKYFCHICNKNFRKMSPVFEMNEVECPDCQQTFCEEIISQSQLQDHNGQNRVHSNTNSQQVQQNRASSNQNSNSLNGQGQQQPARNQDRNPLIFLDGIFSQPQILIRQAPPQPQRRVVRRILTEINGQQAIIEQEYITNPAPQPQPFMFIESSPIIGGFPSMFGLSPFDLNFRSSMNDNFLEQIMRLSMQDRGRSGNPPASQQAIRNLPEVEINEKFCKKNESDGSLEFPRCTVCCEDLSEKATMMPCGHLFNKECIEEWLKQHNQCPVCRYELPTDDADYEARKMGERNIQTATQQRTTTTNQSLESNNTQINQ